MSILHHFFVRCNACAGYWWDPMSMCPECLRLRKQVGTLIALAILGTLILVIVAMVAIFSPHSETATIPLMVKSYNTMWGMEKIANLKEINSDESEKGYPVIQMVTEIENGQVTAISLFYDSPIPTGSSLVNYEVENPDGLTLAEDVVPAWAEAIENANPGVKVSYTLNGTTAIEIK